MTFWYKSEDPGSLLQANGPAKLLSRDRDLGRHALQRKSDSGGPMQRKLDRRSNTDCREESVSGHSTTQLLVGGEWGGWRLTLSITRETTHAGNNNLE